MRLSVDSNDAGYRSLRTLPRNLVPFVTLDGAKIEQCITADTSLGYALVYETNEAGNVVLNAKRDAAKRKQLYGRVEIKLRRRNG